MKAAAHLEVPFASSEAALRAHRALQVDHEGHCETWVEGAILHARAAAATPGKLLATLDDLLANLDVVEGVAEALGER